MGDGAETQVAGATAERGAGRDVNIFVVRRWREAGAEPRYAIAHVRSGRRTVAAGDAGAAAWIGAFGRGAGTPGRTRADG